MYSLLLAWLARAVLVVRMLAYLSCFADQAMLQVAANLSGYRACKMSTCGDLTDQRLVSARFDWSDDCKGVLTSSVSSLSGTGTTLLPHSSGDRGLLGERPLVQ